jgi:ABC-type glycerol-3-phosphate transport system permease component
MNGGIWNSFLFPLLFLTARDKMDTVPIAIFIFSQRYVLRGIALSGVKG